MSDFLFAKPSFVEGLARIIDIGGTLQVYNQSSTPEEADAKALSNDWKAVGNDIKSAIDTHNKNQSK
jgi:hypothetical protein